MEKGKQRLFEVMGRLDKTFKQPINEGFEEIEATDAVEVAPEIPVDGGEEGIEVKSTEDKLTDVIAKVDELYAMVHGEEESEEVPAEELPAEPEIGDVEIETGEVENLQEWNFDKKKGEKEDDEEKDEKKEEKKDDETEVEVKVEVEESKEKIPVAAVAKVGEAK